MSDNDNIPPRGRKNARKKWLRRQFDRAEENSVRSRLRSVRLTLSRLELNDDDAVVIANKMNHCCVDALDLGGNDFGDRGAVAFAGALAFNKTVRMFDLCDNSISAAGAVALANGIARNTFLECFLFNRNSMGDDGVVAFAEALTSNTTLDSISLRSNNATAVGAAKLADTIKTASRLTFVNFAGNNIGVAGAVAFAEALASNPVLLHLSLDACRIGDDGIKEISQALKANVNLNSLFLGSNNISDVGAAAFAEVLKVNSVLKALHLGGNHISAEGAGMLLDGLRMNSVLLAVDLGNNNITGTEGTRVLAEIEAIERLGGADRFFRTLNFRLERGVDATVAVPHNQYFQSERANELGLLLQEENTAVTDLKFPLEDEWTSRDVNSTLGPLLQYIERNGMLRRLTYILRRKWEDFDEIPDDIFVNAQTVDLSVVQSFFAVVANRTAEIDFKLIVDVRWLLNRDNMRVFQFLMKNSEYSFLKTMSVVDFVPYYLEDDRAAVFGSVQFVTALQVNTTLVSLSLEVAEPSTKLLQAWKSSSHHSALHALSLRVNDVHTLLQVFETLPWLVRLQEFHLEMFGDAVIDAWRSRRVEFLRALGRNALLRHVEVFVDGVAERLEQVEWYCCRNEVMPRRMADARAHNPDIARRGGVTGRVVPALSCYPKLLHQASSLKNGPAAIGAGWMLRGLVQLGVAVGGYSSDDSTTDEATP